MRLIFQNMTPGMFLMRRSHSRRPMRAIVLLLAMFALSCGLSGVILAQSPSLPSLGGPYAIGGKKQADENDVLKKVAEFEAFRVTGWGSSIVAKLTPSLFHDSVVSNMQSKVPYADKFQRYNYVVQKDLGKFQILVATWSIPKKDPTYGDVCGKKPLNTLYSSLQIGNGMMINFFTEEPFLPSDPPLPTKVYPCTIDIMSSGVSVDFSTLSTDEKIKELHKDRGVLDAHSKHFMLAQAFDNKGNPTTFQQYPPTSVSPIRPQNAMAHPWAQTKVEYAGEIIVDIEGCQYFINQGSGTYRPEPGDNLKNLREVAKVFRAVLDSPPAFVWATAGQSVRVWPVNPDGYNKKLICP